MEVPASRQPAEEKSTFSVLVTGANSGLGFAICCRLIDEFLLSRPQSQTLHLLFSTRDAAKAADTLSRLERHLQKTLKAADSRTKGVSLLLQGRVKLEGVLVDLLKLRSVKALAEQLLRRKGDGFALDAVVWNAGISGWKGLDWLQAVWLVCTDIVQATTYPEYGVSVVGAVAKKQMQQQEGENGATAALKGRESAIAEEEPVLGQVFTANVFGHYLLTHWLAPVMRRSCRIIWISSTTAVPKTFSIDDIQCLKAKHVYEGSKRLTDLLVLTSNLSSTRPYVEKLLPASASSSKDEREETKRPQMYLTHPGIIGTSFAGLGPLLEFFMLLSFYLARLLGSPWHPVSPYKGAVSAVYAILSPETQLPAAEAHDGKGKWGSTCGFYGDERVARTHVDGWGFCGRVGVVPDGSVSGKTGRYRYAKEVDREAREGFEEEGRTVWRELEGLRGKWEGLLGRVRQDGSVDV